MQQHGSKYLARRPPIPHDPRGLGQKVKIYILHNMVMLHIKLKALTKCNNLVANFARRTPMTLGDGSKGKLQLFQNMVMLHIQLKRITKCSNIVANIMLADHSDPSDLVDGISRSESTFLRTWSCCISN